MMKENIAVMRLSESFALEMGFPPTHAKQIGKAAALHDVGKRFIDPAIINKPGKLTAVEFEAVKLHTKLGAQMLSQSKGLKSELRDLAVISAEMHHEWYNGGGYWGYPTDKLPRFVPIIAVVDVYVACCSKRPYKDPWPPEQTLQYLQTRAGTQFAPDIVGAFVCFIRNNGSFI